MLLLPLFATLIKKRESVNKLAKLSFSILFVLSVVVTVGSTFYSKSIMSALYIRHISESTTVFPILMSCFIAISTTYVFGTLLTANGSLKQLNYLAAFGMILNFIINLLLIPRFGAVGSAWASFVTQFVMAASQVVLASVFFKFKVNYRYLLKLLFFLAGVITIGALSKFITVHWVVSLLILVLASFTWAIILRLLNVKYFIEVIKQK
jgi:O-antigen/teichoic acid export membrane protein